MLAHDRSATLWDAARLLSVGEEGYSYRSSVGARVRTLPEFKEISQFFTAELVAQLADSRSTTTAKLDAPVNKLARLLNSPSIKRVLLNDSLRVDFDRVIAAGEVLIVRGALGAMGTGNTSVLMQLLVGMLDAALGRQQDLVPAHERVAVALKIDEAPLVLNRGFAETIALKRSAGLETVACWQTDAQWVDRDVREQLDALFAHRVYFATASARDARAAASLTMAEFSDSVRPGVGHPSSLGHPDLRLHLPKHHAIASWSTENGRQPAFVAQTIPMHVDPERLAVHAERQRARGARRLTDLRQPHWDRSRPPASVGIAPAQPALADAAETASGAARAATASSEAPPRAAPAAEPAASGAARAAAASSEATARAAPAAEPAASAPAPPSATPSRSAPRPPREPIASAPQARHTSTTELAEIPAASFAELVDLDRAQRVREVRRSSDPRTLTPDPLDLEMLVLIGSLGHLLTSQIHRHLNAPRAPTTTQRRLKRLADAGLLERLQFHRRDGGGVPMCCTLSESGGRLLTERELLPALLTPSCAESCGRGAGASEGGLGAIRDALHVSGWMLAVLHASGWPSAEFRDRSRCVLEPPQREAGTTRRSLRLADLRLPGGRSAHDFLRTDAAGARSELQSFETVRPDGSLTLKGTRRASAGGASAALDLLIERDDRIPAGRAVSKLERYDHFLTGWSLHTARYGRRREAEALVVFLCRDRRRARDCARAADAVLVACRAYAGEYPSDWEYPARRRIIFLAERDAHEGALFGYGVPALPPDVRVAQAHGDPAAGRRRCEPRALLDSLSAVGA